MLAQNLKSDIDDSLIHSILASRSVGEVQAAVAAFISVAEGMDGMHLWMHCQCLTAAFSEWAKPYEKPAGDSAWNAVIVPPEHAPVMLLASYVPLGGPPVEVISGLKKFTAICDEFMPPVCDAITPAEIKRVLNAAQREYRLLNVIAPAEPLQIFRFNYSHFMYNSQCGIPANHARPATIFVFHPKENTVHNRIFIFAHELGHALHFSLTHDQNVLPEGFDKFNESVGVKLTALEEKQEAFADAVAMAILHVKGLRTHFPSQFSRDMGPCFAQYIHGLIKAEQEGSRHG